MSFVQYLLTVVPTISPNVKDRNLSNSVIKSLTHLPSINSCLRREGVVEIVDRYKDFRIQNFKMENIQALFYRFENDSHWREKVKTTMSLTG